ncbi:hypothetical protein NtRootA4_13690 [Arthrobacter sp. NtRootA4]|nr:hypothetical protein NtRootA2_15910 [Arthrobacter sp. NtRootA2]BCW14390.1 hypothetical protein NtRootA4_13690 [Arthrobacter sp. NtRootA4]BCW22725.1 hypothetical protein NtRootC7_15920 [Arthrobacter sp. NtRootC7]BCW26994.1 hypothetical protein NtRootC45_15940 [Arthrobacter sp. NtRootC45]BCW31263.1 hypothetical protein NtRootD5_15940 [Arthrobacter sp. NtRootD5]
MSHKPAREPGVPFGFGFGAFDCCPVPGAFRCGRHPANLIDGGRFGARFTPTFAHGLTVAMAATAGEIKLR